MANAASRARPTTGGLLLVILTFVAGATLLAMPLAFVMDSLTRAFRYRANIAEYSVAALQADEHFFKAGISGLFGGVILLLLILGGVSLARSRRLSIVETIALMLGALVLIAIPVGWWMTVL